ncbi:hypothetical protein [Cellulomonas denverensis]|uniref:Uncharacterized protein n=1 Tax=Cellulomonas denverensis TaxID=264297 RepID=A0A7X6QXR9_9CELL|nr:hypothetical protein [Cellulomonas denverensis]NKY21369.1 hypothetical protein [Cellulomonas denverensis]GIG27308.1 hypothetical protein Cde04nite_35520 [Cellulomonas denverensis]
MACEIVVDPEVMSQVTDVVTQQSLSANSVRDYVETHCTLGGEFGLLISGLKGNYETARDQCIDAFVNIEMVLAGLGGRLHEYAEDMAATEQDVCETLERVTAELDAASSGSGPGGAGTGGAFGGGGSAGGFSGGGGGGGIPQSAWESASGESEALAEQVRAAREQVQRDAAPTGEGGGVPGAGSGAVGGDQIINAGDGVQVIIGEGNSGQMNISIGSGNAQSIGSGAAPDPEPSVGDDELLDFLDPAGDPADDLADLTADAVAYREIWTEMAARDPLGRSPEELRLAWENRDQITIEEAPGLNPGTATDGPVAPPLAGLSLHNALRGTRSSDRTGAAR